MNPRATENPTLRNFTLAGVVLCALLGYAWWKSRIETDRRACRVYASTREHRTITLYGRPLMSWDKEWQSEPNTTAYFDRYLGYPHTHEWRKPSHIASSYAERADMGLTYKGLRLVAASGITDPERRRRYYEEIIQPRDTEHFSAILKTYKDIEKQIFTAAVEKKAFHGTWGPDMEGITIPAEVRAGKILPDDN